MDIENRVYTQGEVDSRILQVRQEEVDKTERLLTFAKANVATDLRDKAIKFFRSQITENELDKEDALSIYNGLAEALGWNKVDSLGGVYTVTISYQDYAIGDVEGIEASDPDEACEMVAHDIYISDPEISFTVSINGDHFEAQGTISTYDYDPTDELTFEAEEQ